MPDIAGFVPERSEIGYRDKPLISVRGLTFDDLSKLIAPHLLDIQAMAAMWENRGKEGGFSDSGQHEFIMRLLMEYPAVAALIIATSADQPEHVGIVRQYPVAIQVRALMDIMRLTMEDFGGPLEWKAAVRMMLDKMKR